MPPQSRRQKKYDEKLRSVQKRNTIAGVVLFVVVVASFLLIRQLIPEGKPELHVSINRVSHSGTREIPFAEKSCETLEKSFKEYLKCTVEEIHEIDENNSDLKMIDTNISSRDVLIVYLNGHLTDGNSHPDAIVKKNSSADQADANSPVDDEVYWIGPEAGNVKKSLLDTFETIDNSKARIKLVLLDAGRYSWSPVFPGREVNQFQSKLEQKLKEWESKNDFWVITSHSDAEISNVSTPLESSLFAIAIEQALKTLKKDRPVDLDVYRFYDEIKKRTASYSRNFSGKSLQNPVLMKAGVGRVDSAPTTETNPMVVTWSGKFDIPDPNPAAPKPDEYEWRTFAEKSDTFSQWLFGGSNYSAIPHQSIEKVEMLLELGKDDSGWAGPSQQLVDRYKSDLQNSRNPRQNNSEPNDFDLEQLTPKQDQIESFRTALLEFSSWIRFRNQMRFWDDNAFGYAKDFSRGLGLVSVDDNDLQKSNSVFPAIEVFQDLLNDFKVDDGNLRLIREVTDELDGITPEKSITPMQAELLGMVYQRYFPLLNLPQEKPALDANGRKVPVPPLPKFTLNLEEVRDAEPFNPTGTANQQEGISQVVAACREQVSGFSPAYQNSQSDTLYRYVLATQGSEFLGENIGLFPDIHWKPINKEIDLQPKLQGNTFRVPPFEPKPIRFLLKVAAIESVGISIVSTDAQPLEGLSFGLTSDFDKDTKVSDFRLAEKRPFSEAAFDVFFQYPKLNEEILGQKFNFKITATDRSDESEKDFFDFSIQITRDADFWLTARRQLGNKSADRSRVRLYRWGSPPSEDNFEPLAIRTLANVKSPFELSLTNNSDSSQDFTVRAYKIRRFPGARESDSLLLRSDRENFELTSNFVKWLGKETDAAGEKGTSPLAQAEYFQLIAESKVAIPNPKSTATIQLAQPVPKVDPAADPNKPVESEGPKVEEIDNGILLAFHYNDESGAPLKMPNWYQMVLFEPEESANPSSKLKVRADILDVFGATDVLSLKQNFSPHPNVDKSVAARVTIVSKTARDENKHVQNALNFDEVLIDNAAPSHGNEPALLLMDVLGVSNYQTLYTNRSAIGSSEFRSQLTGVRVDAPEGWTTYPESWSFASAQPLGSPFQWLAGSANEEQYIFLKEGDAGGGASLEFFLPFKNDLLHDAKDDFVVHWKDGKRTRLYPNERRHFVVISPGGMIAWSQVQSHTQGIPSPSNRLLRIFRADDPTTPLGQWRFITNSLKEDPVLDANRTRLERRGTQLKETMVTLDLSKIQPPVRLEDLILSFEKTSLKKETKPFLEGSKKVGPGKYKFSLWQLYEAVGSPALGSRATVAVEATDFFGVTTRDRLPFTITDPKKVVDKPVPKGVTLDVAFSLPGDKPVELLEFMSVQLDDQRITLDKSKNFEQVKFKRGEDGKVNITYDVDAASLKVAGLLPGKYRISVSAQIRPPDQAQFSSATASGVVNLEQDGATKLIFK